MIEKTRAGNLSADRQLLRGPTIRRCPAARDDEPQLSLPAENWLTSRTRIAMAHRVVSVRASAGGVPATKLSRNLRTRSIAPLGWRATCQRHSLAARRAAALAARRATTIRSKDLIAP